MENKTLIDELYFCAAQCVHCYNACEIEKEKDKLERCMQFDKDCEDICRLTAQLMERNSENAVLLMEACEAMCKKCAIECTQHEHLEHCKKCAEVCNACADMCHEHQVIH